MEAMTNCGKGYVRDMCGGDEIGCEAETATPFDTDTDDLIALFLLLSLASAG
jgi:hypothetical protein